MTQTTVPHRTGFQVRDLRWYICGLLFFATTLNYLQRQTVSVLKPHLQNALHWSESDYGWIVFAFQVAYAVMYTVSGRIMDRLGIRLGYALAMVWWSAAGMAHALARGTFSFGVARFFLGVGEAGNFPAAIKAVTEWFPPKERALATGIFNAGSNVGAVLAPPMVIWLTLKWGWQEAFLLTGSLGFIWLIFWLMFYRPPEKHPWLAQEELQVIQGEDPTTGGSELPTPLGSILKYRQVWGLILIRFMTDPIWWFYVFWLPSYLVQARGFSLQQLGYFGWIPFLAADIGSIAGGWLSGFLIKRGWTVDRARKVTMTICACLMPAGIAGVFVGNTWLALAFISVATSAFPGWSATYYTLASDIFPRKDVGAIVGLSGSGGAVGGMILALTAGYVLQWFHSYIPLFIIAGIMHPLALAVIYWLIPKVEPVARGA
jgi:ACS family hexuronate transporter-like MFS transporter